MLIGRNGAWMSRSDMPTGNYSVAVQLSGTPVKQNLSVKPRLNGIQFRIMFSPLDHLNDISNPEGPRSYRGDPKDGRYV